jgi:eukaryotic-like serine/threonine-protein kinase
MKLWGRLRDRGKHALRGGTAAEPAAATPEPTPPPAPTPNRLEQWGAPSGPTEDEALELLAAARSTPGEGAALEALVQESRRAPLPERLGVAVAAALVDRGERGLARTLLDTLGSKEALLMRADLVAEDGDYASAVGLIERVLLVDLDFPGAEGRRRVWRERLGQPDHPPLRDPEAATVAMPRKDVPFDILREVARGGAGVVFEAKDRELGRRVALKVYHQPARDLPQLLHEARVAASFDGRGVVRVFDVEPDEGWLALEWAPLGALRDLLRGGKAEPLLPLDAWVDGLVDTLARVHAAGWVHHDLKPANVLMAYAPGPARRTVAWLADFGIARRIGEPSPLGSTGFVSPERLAGRASDPSDDVYGLGRVLEEVLSVVGAADARGAARWAEIAVACTRASEERPRDGAAVRALASSIARP